MRRLGFIVLVLILLLSLFYVQLFDVPSVEASSIYQGDLVLTGNNVTIIEGRFDINGSIYVEDNATLHLQNAVLNLTQSQSYQYSIRLRNPSNGNPRLLAYNSTLTSTSDYKFSIVLFSNSSAKINNSTINSGIRLNQYSSISTLNNSYVYTILPYSFFIP